MKTWLLLVHVLDSCDENNAHALLNSLTGHNYG